MNLYTAGEGLFDTHVTWDDIEADMQNELRTVASFGPNKSVNDIDVSFQGFMSKILLIEPDWQNKDKELPKKFLAKVSTLSSEVLPNFDSAIRGHKFEHIRHICHRVFTEIEKFSPQRDFIYRFSPSSPYRNYRQKLLSNRKSIITSLIPSSWSNSKKLRSV
ncbi:unnamed protein product [Haemonchus placei]|uniref:Uncharacterized protein n=1 Tax=Haemonchus placei TaxID=6290 RepID=A0A0N4WSY7_HAEPC|nr:unnamed protein product [Haemonchus placei]